MNTARIRILVAEDHTVVRQGLVSLLSMPVLPFTVVGEAVDGAEAVALAHRLQPDVILMDLEMPVMDGIEAIREIRAAREDARVLVLTSFADVGRAAAAMRAGAKGLLHKDSSLDDLVHAIQSVARGQTTFPADVVTSLLTATAQEAPPLSPPHTTLTEREVAVLICLARGLSNKQISDELHISPNTVRSHVSVVMEKLGVANRTQAALYALEQGIVPPKPSTL